MIFIFIVSVLVFFIYEKVKAPHLTIVKRKKTVKSEKDELISKVRDLMQKLVKNPNDEFALDELGKIFSSMGEWNKAIYFFKRLESLKQTDPKVKQSVAMCYFYMQEYVLAFRKLKEVLNLDPENVFAHFNIALLYAYFLNDKNQAKRHFLFVINSSTEDKNLKKLAEKELEKLK